MYTKAGKNTRPTERGGVAKISTYEASILSAILKEPAPTQKGGGYNQTKPVYPRARIIAPQKEGGGIVTQDNLLRSHHAKGLYQIAHQGSAHRGYPSLPALRCGGKGGGFDRIATSGEASLAASACLGGALCQTLRPQKVPFIARPLV